MHDQLGAMSRFADLDDALSACIASASHVKPAFILGPPRSGTTLLADILARGDGVLSLSEPFFACRALHPRVSRMFFQVLRTYLQWSPRVPDTSCPARLFEFLRDCALHKGQRLIIKEVYGGFDHPHPLSNMKTTNAIINSGAPIIAIVRNPLDTVASTLKVVNRYVSGWRHRALSLACDSVPRFKDEQDIARHAAINWSRFAAWVQRDRPHVVRYEDMIGGPAREVRRACSAVGLAFKEKMLARGRRPPAFGGLGDLRVVLWPPRSIHGRSIGSGRGLSPAVRELTQHICGESAGALGYAL